MPLYLTNLKYDLDQPEEAALNQARRLLKPVSGQVAGLSIYKKSLDARRRHKPQFVVTVRADLHPDSETVLKRLKAGSIQYRPEYRYEPTIGRKVLSHRIIIVGFGPAGIFCAYELAKKGYRPLIIERGQAMDQRISDVETFWNGGPLKPSSNVQFGEGGAGTFSDGKLTTRISDPRCEEVLSIFAAHGAPNDILTKAKPHIGTDHLRHVIVSIRKEIERMGGEIRFNQTLDGIERKDGKISGVRISGEEIACEQLVLAIGHSSRDTFRMLYNQGVQMEAKSFSVGARIEHLQKTIDEGLYGSYAGHPALPPGEYQLSYRENGRGVYTFCMCPGGTVVPSASVAETIVTNGMSSYARDGANANSALVVGVSPDDFGQHPLDGVRFQEKFEHQAFLLAGQNYAAPGMTVGNFLAGKPGLDLKSVIPTYARSLQGISFTDLYPPFITDLMQKGLVQFGQKIPGFDQEDTVLTGPETRTSSPVRIPRGENGQSLNTAGLYPCGEGAGYAGGIMSAAVDGLRMAEAIMAEFAPPEERL